MYCQLRKSCVYSKALRSFWYDLADRLHTRVVAESLLYSYYNNFSWWWFNTMCSENKKIHATSNRLATLAGWLKFRRLFSENCETRCGAHLATLFRCRRSPNMLSQVCLPPLTLRPRCCVSEPFPCAGAKSVVEKFLCQAFSSPDLSHCDR